MSEAHRTYVPAASYDWLLPLYDPLQKLFLGGFAYRALVDQANLQPQHRVLEIGCGTGNVTIFIKQLHPQVDVVGLDPDPKGLARAQRKTVREGLSIRFDRGFADALPYAGASFDRVVSSFMFHHLTLEVKSNTLREALRVLKPGGSLHLLDFGGAGVRADGLLARLLHRSELLQDNAGDRIPTLMREAGFAAATEIAHRKTLFGRIAYYRASL
jgi:ubiquinone/menaquinone biosynthesis C-methylase UbiE